MKHDVKIIVFSLLFSVACQLNSVRADEQAKAIWESCAKTRLEWYQAEKREHAVWLYLDRGPDSFHVMNLLVRISEGKVRKVEKLIQFSVSRSLRELKIGHSLLWSWLNPVEMGPWEIHDLAKRMEKPTCETLAVFMREKRTGRESVSLCLESGLVVRRVTYDSIGKWVEALIVEDNPVPSVHGNAESRKSFWYKRKDLGTMMRDLEKAGTPEEILEFLRQKVDG